MKQPHLIQEIIKIAQLPSRPSVSVAHAPDSH